MTGNDGIDGERVRELHQELDMLQEAICGLKKRASETDPNKQIYGPKMTQKVMLLVDRYESFSDLASKLVAQTREAVQAAAAEATRIEAALTVKAEREKKEAEAKKMAIAMEEAQKEKQRREDEERVHRKRLREERLKIQKEEEVKVSRTRLTASHSHTTILILQLREIKETLELRSSLLYSDQYLFP